jgi:3'(2'), 5'-bisphosphate nucleotidase
VQGDDLISQTDLIDALTAIVSHAAAMILAVRALDTRVKADKSPVTAADEAAEAAILAGLEKVLPGVQVVSEEATDLSRPQVLGTRFVLVDPLDGTRELVAGRDEFCVNLAVVSEGRPRLGIIAAPALGLVWRTAAQGGAERLELTPGDPPSHARERIAIRPRPWPGPGAVAAVSRSHLDAGTESFLRDLGIDARLASGSAIKLCQIAEGTADVYPRLAPVREWDVAAGDAIISAAGGRMSRLDGALVQYGQADKGFLVPGFIAFGDGDAGTRLMRQALISTLSKARA